MAEEAATWGLEHRFEELVDPRSIAREEMEYQTADLVTVPSEFTRQTFIDEGIPKQKVIKVPYGADISRFRRCGEPDRDLFTVLFVGRVSIRKGALYLIDAFNRLPFRNKRLVFAGTVSQAIEPLLRSRDLTKVKFRGQVAQHNLPQLYSSVHVLALPSIEEGLAYVMGEAMACGCPVIATPNSGAEDLFTNSKEGFIVPAREVDPLLGRLNELREDEGLRRKMSEAAILRTGAIGGWDAYGETFFQLLNRHVHP